MQNKALVCEILPTKAIKGVRKILNTCLNWARKQWGSLAACLPVSWCRQSVQPVMRSHLAVLKELFSNYTQWCFFYALAPVIWSYFFTSSFFLGKKYLIHFQTWTKRDNKKKQFCIACRFYLFWSFFVILIEGENTWQNPLRFQIISEEALVRLW